MEDFQVTTLHEDTTEAKMIGGGLKNLQILAHNASLDEVTIRPAYVEEMQDEFWDSTFVRLQVADRIVWLEPPMVQKLVEFLQRAHNASLDYYDIAFREG